MKFPLPGGTAAMAEELERRGASLAPAVRQVDRYFAHPARDFARTGEALRIRSSGAENCITYKGPRLAGPAKTRREVELPLAAGETAAADFCSLLKLLDFRPVGEVAKLRRDGVLVHANGEVILALDEVSEIGAFLELELLAEESELATAQTRLLALAAELQLGEPEPRSYLTLWLARRAGN